MSEIITVKPEFSTEDCFRIVERHKRKFTYPEHRHKAKTGREYAELSETAVRKSLTMNCLSLEKTSSTSGSKEIALPRMYGR